MKSKLLLLALLFTTYVQATHVIGGEITWECLSNGKYEFTVVIYRDGNNANFQTDSYKSINTNAGTSIRAYLMSTEFLAGDCNVPTSNAAVYPYVGSVLKITYKSNPVVLYGTPPPTGWYFTLKECCWPSYVDNLTGNNSQFYLIRSVMYPYFPAGASVPLPASPCYNSSPEYVLDPVHFQCVGSPSSYLGLVEDKEQDSLVYAWAKVKVGGISSPFTNANWEAGYSYNNPLPDTSENASNIPATINAATGEVNFTSYTSGAFATSIKISEYRDGQLISEVFRDIPIFIQNCISNGVGHCNSTPPTFSTTNLSWGAAKDSLTFISSVGNAIEYYERQTFAKPGDTVRFQLTATDLDSLPNCSLETILIAASGVHMSTDSAYASDTMCIGNYPCAKLVSKNANGLFIDSISNAVEFSWYVDCSLPDSSGNTFVLQVINNTCPVSTVKNIHVKVNVQNPIIHKQPQFNTLLSGYNPSQDIELFWSKSDTGLAFKYYLLWHADSTLAPYILDTIPNFTDTFYTHTNPPPGSNRYWIRSIDGCTTELDSVDVNDTTSSIVLKNTIGIEEQLAQLRFYPQPFSNQVLFEGFENEAAINVKVFDVTGRLLKEVNAEVEGGKITVETSDLKHGVYVFVLSWADYSTTIKLIKHE